MCLWHSCSSPRGRTHARRTLPIGRLLLAAALAVLVPRLVDAQPTTTPVGEGPGGAQGNRGGIRMAIAQGQQPVAAESGPASLRPQGSVRGLLGIPLGEFSNNVGLSGGFAAEFTLGLGDGPIRIGGGGSVLWYRSETRRVPFSETIPDVLVDVTTDSGIATFYALLRAQGEAGRVRPYVDGLVGLNYLFTETSVDLDDDWYYEEQAARTTNHRDFALSYGTGGGVMVELVRRPDRTWLALDVGARYVFGERADYLVPGSLGPSDTLAEFGVNRSRTDVLTIHAGVTFGF